ncbi:MAG: YbdK family carboxylate-amine ligase [Nocardioidaceae bacterium]
MQQRAELATPSVADFAAGGEFTLGAEEESLLVRHHGRLRSGGSEQLVAAASQHAARAGTIVPEIFANQIELNTVVCADGETVARAIGDLRAELRRAGAWLMVVGVHPAAALGAIRIVHAERYDAIRENLGGLLRTPTSSLQVHVGMPDGETAITAYRGLRQHLALLRGLAAASPYWHGQDSGLACARAAIMWSYPRMGVPPHARSWEEYVERTARAMAAAEIPDPSFLWWDMRAQPRLGTIEVRVMDAQPSLDRAAGLASLVQGLARAAVERPLRAELPTEVLTENDFRAARYGLDTRITDVDGTMQPLRDLARRALETARATLRGDRLEAPLDAVEAMLREPTEAERQRGVVARGRIPALLHDLVARSNDVDAADLAVG